MLDPRELGGGLAVLPGVDRLDHVAGYRVAEPVLGLAASHGVGVEGMVGVEIAALDLDLLLARQVLRHFRARGGHRMSASSPPTVGNELADGAGIYRILESHSLRRSVGADEELVEHVGLAIVQLEAPPGRVVGVDLEQGALIFDALRSAAPHQVPDGPLPRLIVRVGVTEPSHRPYAAVQGAELILRRDRRASGAGHRALRGSRRGGLLRGGCCEAGACAADVPELCAEACAPSAFAGFAMAAPIAALMVPHEAIRRLTATASSDPLSASFQFTLLLGIGIPPKCYRVSITISIIANIRN